MISKEGNQNMRARILAFLTDHILGTIIFGIIFLAVNWDSFFYPNATNYIKLFDTFNEILAIGIIYYFLKDIIGGRSVGKRLLRIAVRDVDNPDAIPSIFRLILRNVTIIIWPIELLLLMIVGRRIGDILAKTQIKTI